MTSTWKRSAPSDSARRIARAMFEWSASRMLTATRARPPAMSVLHAGRDRLVAPLAAEGMGALVDEPRSSPGDGRRRRLAGPFRRQLAARCTDLLPSVPPDRRGD